MVEGDHWDRFAFYASCMVTLHIDTKEMVVSHFKLETVLDRMPHCFSHLTKLTISLTSKTKTPPTTLLRLIANAPLEIICINSYPNSNPDFNLFTILQPFSSTTSLQGLKLEIPSHPAKFCPLVPCWNKLTDVTITLTFGNVMEDVDTIFDSLSKLPLLACLQLDPIGESNSQRQYQFLNLKRLEINFYIELIGFIENICTPRLDHIHIHFMTPLTEPTWSNIFGHIKSCNPTQTLTTIVVEMEQDYDTPFEIPDEVPRWESFNENTLCSLYNFRNLICLEIRPGISCHLLTDEFYTTVPMHWPMLKTLQLGGNLIFPTPDPVATPEGVVAILDGCKQLKRLYIPHV